MKCWYLEVNGIARFFDTESATLFKSWFGLAAFQLVYLGFSLFVFSFAFQGNTSALPFAVGI